MFLLLWFRPGPVLGDIVLRDCITVGNRSSAITHFVFELNLGPRNQLLTYVFCFVL